MTIFLIFLLLAVVFYLFLSEIVPPDLVALGTLVAVAFFGWISPKQAFESFANEAPITVAAMFILSAGLQRSGSIEDVGRWIRRISVVTEVKLLVVLMVGVAVSSAFVNNTPVVVALMPLVLGVARHYDLKASKLLIPLSYAAIMGGTCSLIGTSTNLVVSSIARSRYDISIGIFEISGLGIIVTITGILYMLLIGRHLLPGRDSLASLVNATSTREYVTQLLLTERSPLAGKRIDQTDLRKIANVRIQQIMRDDDFLPTPFTNVVLQVNDRIVLGAPRSALVELQSVPGVSLAAEKELGLQRVRVEETVVVEAVVTNNSRFAGRTLRESRLRENFNALVLALHRHNENITRDLGQIRLKFGDTLLLRIAEEGLARLRGNNELLVLSDTSVAHARRDKQPIVLAVLLGVIVLAALNVYPISLLALAGVVILVGTRCLRMSEVYDAIDWRIVSMIVGMIALGTAMEETGAAAFLVEKMVALVHDARPIVILGAFYLISTIFTELISNNAVAILMTPIAYQTATALDLRPLPFLIAIMFAASASFATPIGYQTNTFIYGAGGYRFRDFIKVGLPLNLLLLFVVTLIIPLIWPLK